MKNFQFSIFNFQFQIRLEFFILLICLVLVGIPLLVKASFLDEILEDLKEIIFQAENLEDSDNNGNQIINKINVSANTGGNTAKGDGKIEEGETNIQIEVENIVQGEQIPPIEIESEEAAEAKVESEIKVQDDKAYVHREIEIDSETTVEDYEIDLEESASDIDDLEEMGEIEEDLGGLEEVEEEIKESTNKFRGWWENFINNLKSFFINIFNIF